MRTPESAAIREMRRSRLSRSVKRETPSLGTYPRLSLTLHDVCLEIVYALLCCCVVYCGSIINNRQGHEVVLFGGSFIPPACRRLHQSVVGWHTPAESKHYASVGALQGLGLVHTLGREKDPQIALLDG